jgi:hypothetical protein
VPLRLSRLSLRNLADVHAPNVDLHRRVNAAIQALDREALLAVCDPAIEVHSIFAVVGGAVYHGPEGARRWLADLEDAWVEFRIDEEAYFNVGEHTLAYIVLHGRGRQSGAEAVMPYTQVARWHRDRCAYFKAYHDRDDALEALGIDADSLEPLGP